VSTRSIHFTDEDIWQYRVGRDMITILAPDRGKVRGKRSNVFINAVLGYQNDDDDPVPVRPAKVKAYIEAHRADLT
jgi:hypothetical protein